MLWLCLVVWWCLTGFTQAAVAQPSNAAATAAEDDLGVTVTEHTMSVQSSGSGTTVMERWSLRVDNPEVESAGVPIPANFDGASSQGAKVYGDLAIFPETIRAGQVFTFSVRKTLPKYASARFDSIPDIPVESVTMDIRTSGGVPLSLWADDDADIRYAPGSSPRACLLYTSPSPRDATLSRMPSSA